MVRSIAGTLRDVGLGRLPPAGVAGILASRDRRRAGMNCEAGGLYLLRVLYRRRGGGVQPDANAQGPVLDSDPCAPTPSEDE
jgi:tRNA U38,U39,U40 pseudouridine synthase TruA